MPARLPSADSSHGSSTNPRTSLHGITLQYGRLPSVTTGVTKAVIRAERGLALEGSPTGEVSDLCSHPRNRERKFRGREHCPEAPEDIRGPRSSSPYRIRRSSVPCLVAAGAAGERPVRQAPGRAEDRVVQHGEQDLRGALGPGRPMYPGERQPAGPPHTPGEQPERRAHGGLLLRSPTFAAQQAEDASGPYPVGEVRHPGQNASASWR